MKILLMLIGCLLSCTAVAELRGEVHDVTDTSYSGCHDVNTSKSVCTFQFWLRKYDPSAKDYRPLGTERTEFVKARPAWVVHGDAAYLIMSRFQDNDSVQIVGGGAPSGESGLRKVEGAAWDTARYFFANRDHLPFLYNQLRGQEESRRVNEKIGTWSSRTSRITENAKLLNEAQLGYTKNTLTGASLAAAASTKQAIAFAQAKLGKVILAADSPLATKVKIAPPSKTEFGSVSLQNIEVKLEKLAGKPREQWNELEDLESLANGDTSGLPSGDAVAIKQLHEKYFDEYGLLGKRVLGVEKAVIANHLGRQLRTTISSVEGAAVRHEVNRSLVAAVSTSDLELEGHAYAGMGLAVGADAAFADGRAEEGRLLLRKAAGLVDFALGFVPVAGAINDATQFVHGLATGLDYAGNPMENVDYALRGLGVVAGTVGLGTPLKALFRIGKNSISGRFVFGSTILRKMGDASRKLFEVATKSPVRDWFVRAVPESVAVHSGVVERKLFRRAEFDELLKGHSQMAPAVEMAKEGKLRFAIGEEVAHFEKHSENVKLSLRKDRYNLVDYVNDANEIIADGIFLPEKNAFARLIGAGEVGFVGISRDGQRMTTFHIKTLTDLLKAVPSVGVSP